jgi:hypothetical protein
MDMGDGVRAQAATAASHGDCYRLLDDAGRNQRRLDHRHSALPLVFVARRYRQREDAMSERFGQLRREPSRSWKTSDDDSAMRCSLGMEGRVTLREILDHFAEKYPHVDPMCLEFNFATVVWDEPPTADDMADRQKRRADHAARTERWERETLERLTAKYAGLSDYIGRRHHG